MTRSELFLSFFKKLGIRSRDQKIVPFIPNKTQMMIWDKIKSKIDNRERIWMIVLKARREGVSTLSEALILARTVLEDLVHSMVMAHEAPATKRIWEMSELMVQTSPLKLLAKKVGTQIRFGRSTLDIATAGSEHAVRGADITCLHGSEVAFWPDPAAMLAVLQAIPDHHDTLVILESTANGKVGDGELFFNEWRRAEKGESQFIPIFLPWFEFPDYAVPGGKDRWWEEDDKEEVEQLLKQFRLSDEQLAWRRWCINSKCQGDLDKFHQEYPSTPEEAFVTSGLPFFRLKDLIWINEHLKKGRHFVVDAEGKLSSDPLGPVEVWAHPDPAHQYVIGGDPSMGSLDEGRSRSAMEIIDMDTQEQVAEYECASAPHVFAQHMVGLGKYYNNALLAPEIQASGGGGGREVLKYMQELGYWNIHVWRHADRIRKETPTMYGWETNSRTRPRMIARIRQAIQEKSALIHSKKLLQQLSDFGERDDTVGRYEALAGYDDLLFAWGIALVSRAENYVKIFSRHQESALIDPRAHGIRCVDDLNDALSRHQDKVLHGKKRSDMPSYLTL